MWGTLYDERSLVSHKLYSILLCIVSFVTQSHCLLYFTQVNVISINKVNFASVSCATITYCPPSTQIMNSTFSWETVRQHQLLNCFNFLFVPFLVNWKSWKCKSYLVLFLVIGTSRQFGLSLGSLRYHHEHPHGEHICSGRTVFSHFHDFFLDYHSLIRPTVTCTAEVWPGMWRSIFWGVERWQDIIFNVLRCCPGRYHPLCAIWHSSWMCKSFYSLDYTRISRRRGKLFLYKLCSNPLFM